jgi:hypothetical protein
MKFRPHLFHWRHGGRRAVVTSAGRGGRAEWLSIAIIALWGPTFHNLRLIR